MPTLDPVAEAAQHTAKAECSDSTLTNLAFNFPSEINSAIFSTTGLCGVIGYAETTPTFACRKA